MKRIYSIIIAICCAISGFAQTFEEANALYATGDYQEAAQLYEQLLQEQGANVQLLQEQGANAQLLYNLGNAYFKTGDLGNSILCYERALRLEPNYADAKFNLKFAQSRIIDNIEQHDQFFISKWAAWLRNQLREQTWAIISIALFLITLIGLFIFFFASNIGLRKTGFHTAWIALLLAVFSFGFAASLHHRDAERQEAVVMQGIVTVKASPDRSGTDLFTLHEGTEVRCQSVVGEWVEITVGDNRGWLPASTIERI